MLSYLHSFHAGNFADVLKHSVLALALDYLTHKPKPLLYLDTHAGAGCFDLHGPEAAKTGEWQQGIGTLLKQNTPLPDPLINILDQLNPDGPLQWYPGSPLIAAKLLRDHDQLRCHELHPAEHTTLSRLFADDPRVLIQRSDGFASVSKALPPPSRRGLVLIDPPYEVKTDYQYAAEAVITAHGRFATGTILLWYPVVQRRYIDTMIQQLVSAKINNLWRYELGIQPDTDQHGMTASGILAINPPWTLADQLNHYLPAIKQTIADQQGHWHCGQLTQE